MKRREIHLQKPHWMFGKNIGFFFSSTLISHGTQIQSYYNHPRTAQAGNLYRVDWPFAGVFRRPLQIVIGREWCRRSIDSRIYTAENWRPLIEHTICWSRPQVIRQYGPLFALAYFAFVQRVPSQFVVFHAHYRTTRAARALSRELTLFRLRSIAISVSVYVAMRRATAFYQSLKAKSVIANSEIENTGHTK